MCLPPSILQVAHAGGVLWADGAAHSLSRGVDVDHEVQYLRQPDYVTPGVLLMRRQAFLDVGGLDARFGLGPYGDADLAMAMRQRGYQVRGQGGSLSWLSGFSCLLLQGFQE